MPGFAPIPVQQMKPQPAAAAPANTQARQAQSQQHRVVPSPASNPSTSQLYFCSWSLIN
jgi:hypothetical protein